MTYARLFALKHAFKRLNQTVNREDKTVKASALVSAYGIISNNSLPIPT